MMKGTRGFSRSIFTLIQAYLPKERFEVGLLIFDMVQSVGLI